MDVWTSLPSYTISPIIALRFHENTLFLQNLLSYMNLWETESKFHAGKATTGFAHHRCSTRTGCFELGEGQWGKHSKTSDLCSTCVAANLLHAGGMGAL